MYVTHWGSKKGPGKKTSRSTSKSRDLTDSEGDEVADPSVTEQALGVLYII